MVVNESMDKIFTLKRANENRGEVAGVRWWSLSLLTSSLCGGLKLKLVNSLPRPGDISSINISHVFSIYISHSFNISHVLSIIINNLFSINMSQQTIMGDKPYSEQTLE